MMKKVILMLMMGASTMMFSQTEEEAVVLNNILGVWQNTDGEFLRITRDLEQVIFQRASSTSIKAVGTIQLVEGEMHITRADVQDEYDLCYYVGSETMVICKPNQAKAWLWTKIGN